MASTRAAIQLDKSDADALCSRLARDVESASSDLYAHVAEVQRYREYLKDRQPRVDKPWKTASELSVPYVKSTLLAMLSHVVPTLLGADPLVHVVGNNRASQSMADNMETFYHALYTRVMDFRRRVERVFMGAFRDGTAIGRVVWTQKWRPGVQYVDAGTGDGLVVPQAADVMWYDAPELTLVPIDRFGTFPRANVPIDESPGVFCRYPMTGAELKSRGDAGVFDVAACERVLAHTGDAAWIEDASSFTRRIVAEDSADHNGIDQTYQVTEIYYRYDPKGMRKGKAFGDWRVVIHEPTQTLLAAGPTPWAHGMRPYVALSPYVDVEGLYGDSVASAGAGQTQLALTTLLRLAVDAMAIGIAPEIAYPSSLGETWGKKLRESRGPGTAIMAPDQMFTGNGAAMTHLQRNGYDPNAAIAMMQTIDQICGQQSTGASDNLKQAPMNRDVTATEATQIMESSQKVLTFLTERCADFVSDVALLVHGLMQQFQGNAQPLALWDDVCGESGLSLYDAMQGSYTLSSNGVRDTANRAVQRNISLEVFQLLRQEPLVWNDLMLRHHAYEDVLRTRGVNQTDRVIGTVEDWQAQEEEAKAQVQAMMAAQGAPGGEMEDEMPQGAPMEGMPVG